LRVCIITIAGHGVGGMQDHTRDLARGLAAAGHDVEVITTRHPHGLSHEQRDGVTWHFVDAPGRHARLPFHHPAWLAGSLSLFRQLHGQRPFDLVHSESTSAFELVRRGEHRHVPLVVEYHGTLLSLLRAAWGRARRGGAREHIREAKSVVWLLGMHFQRGECFRFRDCEWIVPSRQQFEDTRRGEFMVRSRGHVVPNGVDTDLFRPREHPEVRAELGLGEEPTLVSVGRLNVEKGVDIAIRGLVALRRSVPDARLVIVGRGEEQDALEALTARLGLDSAVTFVGVQPAEQVARYMAAADIFLFPTMRQEAAPLVLPQAMACGVPVIASRIGGITEVIGESGEAGLLIPPGDERALVAGIEDLLANEEAQERLRHAARERVLAEYTLERMVERTLDVYQHAIRRQAGASRPVRASMKVSG
jgi:glycosyltransferase involved in cell wall biosynthesis